MANTRRAQGAGSVYLRKDGRFAASATYEGKRITKYGKTKKEAWENLQTYLDDLKAGKIVTSPKQTVGQYLTNWLENQHRLQIGIASLDSYRSILRAHLIPAFGHLQLNQLTREKVQSYYVGLLDGGLSPSRIQTINAVLSSALSNAVLNDLLLVNVCDKVVLPRRRKRKPNVLNREQSMRLVAAARGRRLWFLLLMALTTAARVGELLSLHWEDIDLENGCIHIHRTVSRIQGKGKFERSQPKTSSGARRVLLTQVVIDGLKDQKAYVEQVKLKAGKRWKDLGLIFPNRNGSYMDDRIVRRELRNILAEVGYDYRRFHELRHSAATILFAAGINPKVVQEMMGHSSIAITLGLYGDVLPDMQQGARDVMNDLFE